MVYYWRIYASLCLNELSYFKLENSLNYYNGVFVWRCHSSKSILPFNFWLMYEIFYFKLKKETLFSTHLMILRNFCFLFFNWKQVVIVSYDSQYVVIRKLKCHYTKLHRTVKQIYILAKGICMDNGQLELCPRFIRIWRFHFQRLRNPILLLILNVDHRPVLVLVLVLINQ